MFLNLVIITLAAMTRIIIIITLTGNSGMAVGSTVIEPVIHGCT